MDVCACGFFKNEGGGGGGGGGGVRGGNYIL